MNTVAAPNCYSCKGTATIIGFGLTGRECACVAHCSICDGALAWAHDDERAPLLCAACECPSTKRSIFCEGLATFLVLYTDTTGESPTTSVAYVDEFSEEAARLEVLSWDAGDDAEVLLQASPITMAWERAEARRYYREQAGELS